MSDHTSQQDDQTVTPAGIPGMQPEVKPEVENINTESIVSFLMDLSKQIQENIEKKFEPIDQLKEINQILNEKKIQISEAIEQSEEPLKTKAEFYKQVFKLTADKMLAEKVLSQPGYLPQILRFFRNILVNFFPMDIEEESLAEIVHSLFNTEAPLYSSGLQGTNLRRPLTGTDPQSFLEDIDEQDLSTDQLRIKQEFEWRQSLQVGDKIDAISDRTVQNHKISHWAPATISHQLNEQEFFVSFDNESIIQNRKVTRMGPEIAQPGTFTDDFDWRYDIINDSRFDSLDSEGVWYKSTCLDTRTTQTVGSDENPREMREVYVGFRIYDEEEGHKVDDDGRKYQGWSNRYDEWVTVTSPTIQRLGTLIKHYKIVGKQTMIYDCVVEDLLDVLQNTKSRKIWTVPRNAYQLSNLRCIPDYLNTFGQRGGFTKIFGFFNKIGRGETRVSLKHLSLLIDFLSKTQPMWHRQFACAFIPELKEAFTSALLYTDNKFRGPTQQKFPKETLTTVQRAMLSILRRYYTPEHYNIIMAELMFNVGFSLMKSEKLEMRIQGLKEVCEQIKGTKMSIKKTMNAKDVMAKLKQENIFELIFGEHYHIQLIQRASEIIKFYLNEKEMTEYELDMMWSATKKDQQSKMEIYKIISDIAIIFRSEEIELLVDRFAQVVPESFVEKEIECVYELSKYTYKQASFSLKAARLFWDIAIRKRPYKKQVIELAIDKFIDLIRNQERDQKGNYILKAIKNLKKNNSSLQSIKIMQKILDQIPSYKISNQPTQYEAVSDLVQRFDLINLVIFDLAHYEETANDLWNKGFFSNENIENYEPLDLPFSHRNNVFVRLSFIRQILQQSQSQIDPHQLDQIWDMLVVHSKVSIDSDIFFNWLKQLLNDQNKVSQELMKHFFQTKVCSNEVSFKTIRKAGFECVSNLFLQINELEDKILILSMPNQANQGAKLDFRIHVPPQELIGMEVLWKMLQECDKKNNDLVSVVIDLITKVYHNLASIIEDQIHSIEDQFCQESLTRLKNVILDPQVSDDDKKNFTHIITIMMKSFFEDSEKNGTVNMRPHLALEKGVYIEKIVIQNNITQQKNCPKYIELNTYSNMTIWELKKIIAGKLKQSPLRIQIQRSDQKKKLITDMDHQKTLREMKIENYELLLAQKKPLAYMTRIPLITKRKELVPEARAIFESWFDKFSNAEGIMTPETCAEFIRNSTSDNTVTYTDQRIVRLFNEYDEDIDGLLKKEEFLKFYKDRAIQKPELVWSNLNQHGIGNDLRPTCNQYLQDDPLEIKNPSLLPRFKLSAHQNIFNELFNIISRVQGQSQDELWSLIQQLRTNPIIFSKMLALNEIQEFTSINNTVHQLLYNLQIVEYFLNEFQVQKPKEMKCYYVESQDFNVQNPSIGEVYNPPAEVNSEYERDVQSAAPESGKAIPLPEAQNIPEAPPNQMLGPLIGPQLPPGNFVAAPSSQQVGQEQQKVKDMLDQFKGHIIPETLEDTIISQEELKNYIGEEQEIEVLKQNWIQNFVNIGGFSILLNLLENLQTNASNSDQEFLKNKVDRECLNQIMKIMKVLLMSSFLANSPSLELSQEFQRKMSSKDYTTNISTEEQKNGNQEAKKEETKEIKSAIQSEQEDAVNQYEPLIKLFVGELGSQVLGSIDFKLFQQLLLSIIQQVLKKEKILLDDKSIIDQGISLWISCLVFNSDLLEIIYQDYNNQESKDKTITNMLIENGLLSGHLGVRGQFRDALKFISLSIKSQTLSEQPYIFFLRVLLKEMHVVEQKAKDSKNFFQLLKILMEQYLEAQKKKSLSYQQIFNPTELLYEYIDKIMKYQSTERKSAFIEDSNLVGWLNLIQLLIQNNPDSLTKEEYHSLIVELIERDLFTFNLKPLTSHITKEVDIVNYEKPFINKCQSFESRKAAFTLLEAICKNNPELIREVISKYWNQLLFKVKKPKKQGYQPRQEGRSFYGYAGIKNLGCICYMNAMIQQFFNIPTFRYSLMSVNDHQPPNWQDFEGEKVDDNMLHQLMKLMGFLELTERQDYNPREFCFSFKDFQNQPTNVRIQQDSQEFLNLAFDRIEKLLANTSQKYLLQNVFGGRTCSMMICKSCGNLRQRLEDFYNLSLEVKNQKSIHEGLKKFISGEIINDFQCEACHQRVDVERKTVIEQLPNMLIIHLSRIYFDFETMHNQKLNSRVEFPNILNLKQYMLSEIMKQEQETLKKARKEQRQQDKLKQQQEMSQARAQTVAEDGKADDENLNADDIESGLPSARKNGNMNMEDGAESSAEEDNLNQDMSEEEPEQNFEYKLVGVVVHMGTADAGHYISYINVNRGQKPEDSPEWAMTEKEKWLEFNDSLVKDYRFSNLEEDCFGGAQSSGDFKGDYSKNAYMLIYEKRVKQKIKVVIPEIIVQQSQSSSSLDCDGTAISRAQITQISTSSSSLQGNDDFLILNACPQLKSQLDNPANIIFDNEKKEHYTLIDFNSVEKFVPNEIYEVQNSLLNLLQQVHNDNHTFLIEKQVFNNSFFETTRDLLQQMILSNSDALGENTQETEALFKFIDRLVFDLLSMTSENKTLADMAKLMLTMFDKNEKQTINLIENRILVDKTKLDKDQKTFFESLISHLEKDVRDLCAMVLVFTVNKMVQVGNIEMYETLMNQMFGLLPDEASKNWLKVHQFLSSLFDITKYGAEQMKYMIGANLISKLIDFFVENESPYIQAGKKRQPMGSNYATPPLEQLILNISWLVRHQPYIKLPSTAHQDNDDNQLAEISPSPFYMSTYGTSFPPLSVEDKNMLSLKAFVNKGMRCGYESIEFGRLMGHLSYNNYGFSRMLCKRLLVGINKSNSDEIFPYLQVFTQVICIPDRFMEQRFEWLLGIPTIKIERPVVYQQQNKTRLGVEILDAVNDEILEYRSTLFKTYSTVKESFLQILHSHKKRWAKYSLNCLHALLNACQQNSSGKLFHYLRTMDPPTYAYARYLDWIQPYLIDHIDLCMRNANIISYQQELQQSIQIQQILDQLNERFPQEKYSQAAECQDQAKILEYDCLLDGGPQQYMIWNYEDERIFNQIQLFDNGIEITISEYKVKVSDSKPDGTTNHKFPEGFFRNNYSSHTPNKNQGQVQKSFGRGQTRAYGRGAGHQSQWVAKNQGGATIHTRQVTNGKTRGGRKAKGKKIITSNAASQQDTFITNGEKYNQQDNQQDEVYGNDYSEDEDEQQYQDQEDVHGGNDDSIEVEYDDDNQTNAQQFVDVDPQIQYDQDVHGQLHFTIDTFQNQSQPSYHTGGIVPQVQSQDAQVQDQFENPQAQKDDQQMNPQVQDTQDQHNNQDVQHHNEKENSQQQDVVQIETEVLGGGASNQQELMPGSWEEHAWAVMVVHIMNDHTSGAQQVILKFQDEAPDGYPLNFKIPKSEIKVQVIAGREKEALVFTKLRPFDDWGLFNLEARVDNPISASGNADQNQNGANNAGYSAAWQGEPNNTPYNGNGVNYGNDPLPEQNHDMMIGDDKPCPSCTFLNSSLLSHCEICGGVL